MAEDRLLGLRGEFFQFGARGRQFGGAAAGELAHQIKHDGRVGVGLFRVEVQDRVHDDAEFRFVVELGERADGVAADGVLQAGAVQQFEADCLVVEMTWRMATLGRLLRIVGRLWIVWNRRTGRSAHLPELIQEFFGGKIFQGEARTGLGGEGDFAAFFFGLVVERLQRAGDFFREEVEGRVGRVLGRDEQHFVGFRLGEEAGGPEGHQADSRGGIGRRLEQQFERLAMRLLARVRHGRSARQIRGEAEQIVTPRREDTNGGGAGAEVGRLQNTLKQIDVDHVAVLMDP